RREQSRHGPRPDKRGQAATHEQQKAAASVASLTSVRPLGALQRAALGWPLAALHHSAAASASGRLGAACNVKATRAPPSGLFSDQMRPPCGSTTPCAIARRSPEPSALRDRLARQKRTQTT